MKKQKKKNIKKAPSSEYIPAYAENAIDLVNKYGTYNIQDTADSENTFPAIAQGLAKSEEDTAYDKYDIMQLEEK